jgi:hypothetical protein
MDTWVCTTCQWDKRKVSMVGPDDVTIDNMDPPEGATRDCRWETFVLCMLGG